MSLRLLTAVFATFVVVAACTAGPSVPNPASPSNPAGPSASPSPSAPHRSGPPASPAPASPTAPPSANPTPTPSTGTPTPTPTRTPTESPLSVEEAYLLAGVRVDLHDCVPVRSGLPLASFGGIECSANDPAVARVGFYSFDGDVDMVNAYFARMDAEGVERDSGSCDDGQGEHAYMPGDDGVQHRHGCFVNDEGFANYRATLPIHHVYIGVLGRTADTGALEVFAWRGNLDVPGSPTLWAEPVGGY